MERHSNDGLRKLCDCARRTWAKCEHPWHFNFKWNGENYRFSLDRRIGAIVRDAAGAWKRDRATLGERITDKTTAIDERDRLRTLIRAGALQQANQDKPQRETLTLAQLLDTYRKRYLEIKRRDTLKNTGYQISVILRTELERPDGARRAFGDWLVTDIKADTIEQFQRIRLAKGVAAANRDLSLLRAMFSWGVGREHVERTPFKKGTEVVVRLSRETKRRRRLQPGEGDRLLAACGPHLRAVVEAALETGCRKGELLSLQWWQVRFEPKAEIFLPALKTKTKSDRTIPISARLRSILDMRRNDPEGKTHPPTAYVFGNEVGEAVKSFKRAWERAVLKSHGHKPRYVAKVRGEGDAQRSVRTAALTPESRAQLRAIDLHFHDLRREAGSRWLDGGVPLHRIKQWLGHANISQTSTYLEAEAADNDEAMRQYEERQARLQRIATGSETGHHKPAQSAAMRNSEPQDSPKKLH
jgi:integrase